MSAAVGADDDESGTGNRGAQHMLQAVKSIILGFGIPVSSNALKP